METIVGDMDAPQPSTRVWYLPELHMWSVASMLPGAEMLM